jgi:hypothetical protein
MPSPFPWLWFRWMVDGDKGNLVNPLMRVTNQMTRQLAALRDSQSLPPFTRGWLSLITLAFRALGRKHTVSSPCEGIAMLCYKRNTSGCTDKSSPKILLVYYALAKYYDTCVLCVAWWPIVRGCGHQRLSSVCASSQTNCVMCDFHDADTCSDIRCLTYTPVSAPATTCV